MEHDLNAAKIRCAVEEKVACEARSTGGQYNGPCRESTVGEVLDMRIHEGERMLACLRDLKASLPGSFVSSPQSRLPMILAGWPR